MEEEFVPLNPSEVKAVRDSVKDSTQVKERPQSNIKGAITASMSNADVVDTIINSPIDQIIPWEEVDLPSRGLYYGWPNGVIKVRAWGADVDKILATQRLAQSGQSMNMLIDRCVKYPAGFTSQDLLIGDQVFLLYYLRGITYGNEYEFLVTTPSKHKQIYKTDLNDLQATLKIADPILGSEPFKVSLPYLSEQTGRDVYVSVRFLRVKDQQSIAKQQASWKQAMSVPRVRVGDDVEDSYEDVFKESNELDDTVTKNISHIIVSIMDSVTDKIKIQQFVDKLHSSDIATIRTWLKDNTPGINPIVTLTDPVTGEEFKVALPITEAFFRRTDTRRIRA